MDFLTDIVNLKRARLERAKAVRPLDDLWERARWARALTEPHRFRASVGLRGRVNIIAEMKRASPSKGVIREDADPARIAKSYQVGGAAAVSVLTEEDRFRGSLDDLRVVRGTVALPVLRKDFIFDEYQICEAAEAGADALLLIVAMLEDESLARLRRIAEEEFQMDALAEVHTEDEMKRAADCGATLIGINNRDLRTFSVSLDISANLARHAPAGALLISESGLRTGDDIRRLRELNYSAFLIGESLMREAKPEDALRKLIKDAEG